MNVLYLPPWLGGGLCPHELSPDTEDCARKGKRQVVQENKAAGGEERRIHSGVNETKLKLECLSVLQLSSGAIPRAKHLVVLVDFVDYLNHYSSWVL